jgi:hypothetical protein
MRCNDFDAHIDEMLSGVLHPDASQHMRQCERCTSYFRARAAVQDGLRKLASAPVSGPSMATDRAVLASYRRLQQRRTAASGPAPVELPARVVAFPDRSIAPAWFSRPVSRTWWTGAAAAAVVLVVLGSSVHLWNGGPTVHAPVVATTPAASTPALATFASPSGNPIVAANSSSRHGSPRLAQSPAQTNALQSNISRSNALQSNIAQPNATPSNLASVNLATASPARPAVAYGEASNFDSTPVTHLSPNASPVLRLANAGAAGSVAQSASSTWPGYSNLMYCDPVVCSGPMQVVHIKVPVGQVKPNLGQTVGNAFVNAEVVVGPDGVARAIRVAN